MTSTVPIPPRPYRRRALLCLYFAALVTFACSLIAFCSKQGMSDNGMGVGFLLVAAVGLALFVILLACAAWLWFSERLRWPLWLPLGAGGAALLFAFASHSLQGCSNANSEAVPATAPPPAESTPQDSNH